MEFEKNKKKQISDQIKAAIIRFIEDDDIELQQIRLSVFISNELNKNYKYLSGIFSDEEGISIEKFYIQIKTEKIKKLLSETDHSLKEIADLMKYSSVQHFTAQFKKATGIPPGDYRKMTDSSKK